MITIVAKSRVKPGKTDQFLALAQELVKASQQEEGCLAYHLYEDIQDANTLTFIEQWQSMEAIAAHSQSPHFTSIIPKLNLLRETDRDVTLYRQLP